MKQAKLFSSGHDKDPDEVLENAHKKAKQLTEKNEAERFVSQLDKNARGYLEVIAKNAEKQKGVTSALITSLAAKIVKPNQDIRYHRKEMKGGYSARSFDTQHTTPFLRKKFTRLAMGEAGWLTRSIEQPHPFTLDFPGKIRNRHVKDAFLRILNDVEENKANPQKYLAALFIMLIKEASKVQTLLKELSKRQISIQEVSIDSIVNCLRSHFSKKYHSSGASKLPVIAIFSVYEIMVKELDRFHGEKLEPLRSHLSPDMRAGRIGDIEVTDKNGKCFEAVEIKYGKPITADIIDIAYEKFKRTAVERYYLLTTSEPYIRTGEEENIKSKMEQIRNEHGCELIVNGIMPSIKYYLRLIRKPQEFIDSYTNNLKLDVSKTTEIKEEHAREWLEILRSVFKNNTCSQ